MSRDELILIREEKGELKLVTSLPAWTLGSNEEVKPFEVSLEGDELFKVGHLELSTKGQLSQGETRLETTLVGETRTTLNKKNVSRSKIIYNPANHLVKTSTKHAELYRVLKTYHEKIVTDIQTAYRNGVLPRVIGCMERQQITEH